MHLLESWPLILGGAAILVVLFIIGTFLWLRRVRGLHRELVKAHPSSVYAVSGSTKPLALALDELGYVDELGAGMLPSDFPPIITIVGGDENFELWSPSRGGGRLLYRMPWSELANIESARNIEPTLSQPGLRVTIVGSRTVVLPLPVFPERRLLGPEDPAKLTALADELNRRRSRYAPPGRHLSNARNSRDWKGIAEALGSGHVVSPHRDERVDEIISEWNSGASVEATVRLADELYAYDGDALTPEIASRLNYALTQRSQQ